MRLILFASLLLTLGACAPVMRYLPPSAPIVFETDYDTLFDATLQTMTAAYVSVYGQRISFAIAEAERDTGLITALRERISSSRSALYGRGRITDGVGLRFRILVPDATERTIISAIVRPEGERASLIYSSTGNDTYLANELMAGVVAELDAQFGIALPTMPDDEAETP